MTTMRFRVVGAGTVLGIALAMSSAFGLAARAESGTQSMLTAVAGQGSGFVSVSPTAQDHGNLFVEDEVNLHNALPTTTYTIQRAVDFNPADVAQGICTIAPSLPFGWHTEGTLTTSAGGAGAAHIAGSRPPKSGTQFDLILRVMNATGTQLLMSDCLTISVK
jgi:hypothetical protein